MRYNGYDIIVEPMDSGLHKAYAVYQGIVKHIAIAEEKELAISKVCGQIRSSRTIYVLLIEEIDDQGFIIAYVHGSYNNIDDVEHAIKTELPNIELNDNEELRYTVYLTKVGNAKETVSIVM